MLELVKCNGCNGRHSFCTRFTYGKSGLQTNGHFTGHGERCGIGGKETMRLSRSRHSPWSPANFTVNTFQVILYIVLFVIITQTIIFAVMTV